MYNHTDKDSLNELTLESAHYLKRNEEIRLAAQFWSSSFKDNESSRELSLRFVKYFR